VRSFRERGDLVLADGAYDLSEGAAAVVPPSLHALIAARLDRLPPSARELAVAAGDLGSKYVLVTGITLPGAKGAEGWVDNVLASPQGAITGEKFERFEASFVGAGETLAAALAALLASGQDLHLAVGEALSFLDQALDAGFRPGMGSIVPDRFFWALPEAEEGEEPLDDGADPAPDLPPEDGPDTPRGPRRIH